MTPALQVADAHRVLRLADAAVAEAARQQAQATTHLRALQDRCAHVWGATEWCGTETPGRQHAGDRPGDPGYGGVDRQLPWYEPPKRTDRWRRVCTICGLVEETDRVKEHKSFMPQF